MLICHEMLYGHDCIVTMKNALVKILCWKTGRQIYTFLKREFSQKFSEKRIFTNQGGGKGMLEQKNQKNLQS